MDKIKLSIVVPCYNEAKNIPLLLKRFASSLKKIKVKYGIELIIVDNNSKDDSAKVIRGELKSKKYPYARSVFQPIPGYGAAVIKGLKSAKGEYLCWTHADLQTDLTDTLRAAEIMEKSKDREKIFIKGKRYGRPLSDNFFTFGMSIFETLILGKFLYDINAQPNLFLKSFLKLMKNCPEDFSFDLYTYYLAKKKDYKIIRFPVYFGKRLYGHSAWNFGFKSRIKFIKRTIEFTRRLKKNLNA